MNIYDDLRALCDLWRKIHSSIYAPSYLRCEEEIRDLVSRHEAQAAKAFEAWWDRNGVYTGASQDTKEVAKLAWTAALESRPTSAPSDSGMCPHGYPQTVRCSRCGE